MKSYKKNLKNALILILIILICIYISKNLYNIFINFNLIEGKKNIKNKTSEEEQEKLTNNYMEQLNEAQKM